MIFVSYNYKDMFILYQEMNIFNAHLNTVFITRKKGKKDDIHRSTINIHLILIQPYKH